jgi:SAM-dependent methyltransferase
LNISKERLAEMLANDRFPLASKYDPQWVLENEMGPNVLWLTEELCRHLALRPGMRVLDMGCGRGMSSIFLAREFGVRVWATDLWIAATENWVRVREAGCEDLVCPVHAEAHALPYAEEFFDAAVSMDAYHYFGTDDTYVRRFVRFVRSGGQIGIVVPGLMRDFEGEVPEHLTRVQPGGTAFWDPSECFSFHTADWWRRHWEQTGLVEIERAEALEDGGRLWLQWAEAVEAAGTGRFGDEAPALRADEGRYLGFVVMVARRRGAPE